MRKPGKALLAVGISLALALTLCLSVLTAFAADLSETLDFITSVSLTDRDGNPFESDIPRNSDLKLTYEFAIPNSADVFEGDTFTLHIPEEIAISAPGSFEIIDNGSGQIIGNGTIAVDGMLVITFTSFVEDYSNIQGSFWFDLAFDDNKIGYDDPYVITFEVGATTDPYTIEIDFDQPAPPEATIEKTGSFNAATKEITWTVTINPENVVVANAVVTDDIDAGQTFVPGSVTINGNPADSGNYDYTAPMLTYTFPATISSEQVITFKTTVDDSEFAGSSEGATITERNTAELTRDGGGAVSNDATVSTTVDYIRKSGSYSSSEKRINWTIVINSNYVTIPNAVITDTLPAGLILDSSTLKYDEGAFPVGTTIDYLSPTLTFTLGQSISELHTITFSTDVDPDYYEQNQSQTFTNSAVISGTNVPANAAASRGIGVTSTVLDKRGHAYDRSTGQITWWIYVNTNAIDIDNCIVTDDIRNGQEFVAGSLTIDSSPASDGVDYTYTAPHPTDASNYTGLLTIPLGDIGEQHLISFKTQVTDLSVFMSNATINYYNTAKVNGDNIPESSDTASRQVYSRVNEKYGNGYNYETREISWRIVVDGNNMGLENVVLTDYISNGQEYVADSIMFDGNPADPGDFTYTPLSGDPNYSGVIVYNLGDIDAQQVITLKTVVTDLSVFQTNGDKVFYNNSRIDHLDLPGGVSTSGNQTVQNTVISKTGEYTAGNKYIDWTVIINTNTIPLSDAVITDTFQEGLALDTNTLQLYQMNIEPDGSLTEGDEISLGSENVEYDISTRTLTFTIPAPVSGAYRLTFRTNVTDKSKSPFTNSAYFAGTGTEQTGTSTPISVSWAGSGSSGTGETGSIRVYKVDSRDDNVTLEGCIFELVDRYGNVVQTGTTGQDGSILFEMLKFDVDYTVRELTPPEGYLLSDESYTFQIDGEGDEYDIEYRYADDVMMGKISLTKYDYNMEPVPGAEFTLYDADDTDHSDPLMTALSGEDGAVVFEDVDYGSYVILETTPAPGYYGSSTVITATIDEDGEEITADPSYIQNEAYLASVRILKTKEDGETPLAGAVMGLYLISDTNFSDPVAQATSGENGLVLFENIKYGDYVIREILAPTGYARSSETISVMLRQDGEMVDAGIFENRKPGSPGTGDSLFVYISIFATSALGLAALVITKKKKISRR